MINRKPKVFVFDGLELFSAIYNIANRDDQLSKELYQHCLSYLELILLGRENEQGFKLETTTRYGDQYTQPTLAALDRYLAMNQYGYGQITNYIREQREFHDVVLTLSWGDYLDFRITVRSICPDKEFEEMIRTWVKQRKEKDLFVPYAYLEIGNLP